jgi:hypothetical protein
VRRVFRRSAAKASAGQSLAEFALVLPVLLVLVLGIADLGRAFAVGIVLEGAARDGAEIGARGYLKENPTGPPSPPGTYYVQFHAQIARAFCAEVQSLPDVTFDSGTGDCPGLPLQVCVHDGADDMCSSQPFGAVVPPDCTIFTPAPSTSSHAGTGETSKFVEVRYCYRFSPLTQAPFFSFSTIFLQGSRTFTVTDY